MSKSSKSREPNEIRDHMLRILAKYKDSRVPLPILAKIINPNGVCNNTFTSTYLKLIDTTGRKLDQRLARITEEEDAKTGKTIAYLNIEPAGLKIVERLEREIEDIPDDLLLPKEVKIINSDS